MTGRIITVAVLATTFALTACSSEAAPTVAADAPASAAAAGGDSDTLSGTDLDVATANCNAYEEAVYNTRIFHQRLGYGAVKSTIAGWMDMYDDARRGIEFSPVSSHPELTQAFVAVGDTYDESLEKLDHYTGSTDMSADVMRWNDEDEHVAALCAQLPEVP